MSLAVGVGLNDRARPSRINGKKVKQYVYWMNMLNRCYNPKIFNKHKTYVGCEVSDNFKSYAYFS